MLVTLVPFVAKRDLPKYPAGKDVSCYIAGFMLAQLIT